MPQLTTTAERFVNTGAKWAVNGASTARWHRCTPCSTSEHPYQLDDLVDLLGVARSNISTSIKELQSWGLDSG